MNTLLIFDVNPCNPESIQKAMRKAKTEASGILKFIQQNILGYFRAELNEDPDYLIIRDTNRFEIEYIIEYDDLLTNKMF